jgi:hypothetical protein
LENIIDRSPENDFADFVKGKRCIVLAPSGFLKGQGENSRRFIESFDVVVKNTNMCEIDDQDGELGKRCDIWYGWPATEEWELSIESLQQQNIKYIRLHSNADNYKNALEKHLPNFMQKVSYHKISYSIVEHARYSELVTTLNCIPFTGVLAIYDLLANGASKVFAYGHDFYRTGYFNGRTTYQPVDVQWHKTEPQMAYVYNLLKHEPRFNTDLNLKTILYQHFGEEDRFRDSARSLLEVELSKFCFDDEYLIVRSCNIEIFNSILSNLTKVCKKEQLTLVCQEEFVDQVHLIDNVSDVLVYKDSNAYSFDELRDQFQLDSGRYKRCIMPYNGRPLIEYYELFKWVDSLNIEEVLLVSKRGAIKLIDDVEGYLIKLVWYCDNRRKALEAMSEFDRHNCL